LVEIIVFVVLVDVERLVVFSNVVVNARHASSGVV
jgi:hypothetical protein